MDNFNTGVNSAIGKVPDFPFCDIDKNVDGQNRGQLGGRSLTTTSCTAQCITEKLDDDKSRSLAQRECVHQGDFPLLIGDHQRRTEYLQMLNEAGEDISNVVTTAFQGGEIELLILLECLKSTRLSQTTLDNALREAAKQGQIECLDILGTAGAKDLDGALYCAVEADKVAVQFDLLRKGAHSSSLLHTAASKDSLEYLSDKFISTHINATDENGQTPLHIAAAKGHIKSLKKLIETRGVDINIADKSGCTPLHLAVEYGSIEAVKLLLGVEGIMVNEKNNDCSTALHLALMYADAETVKLLLAVNDIQVNKKDREGRTALHFAAMFAKVEIVKALLARNDIQVNERDRYGRTPLHLAVRYADAKTVSALMGADNINVNAKARHHFTPLHVAAEHADAEVIRLLVSNRDIKVNEKSRINGYNPSYCEYYKYTPIHLAVKNGRVEAVRELLKAKDINVKKKTNFGVKTIDLAHGKNKKECKDLLKAHLKRK